MLAHPLGDVLLSQDPAVQVPSALEGLTVVFGMGTRGSPPPSPPNGYLHLLKGFIRGPRKVIGIRFEAIRHFAGLGYSFKTEHELAQHNCHCVSDYLRSRVVP